MESALLALCAAALGAAFAWWSAPFVVARINPPDSPARLDLPAGIPLLGFSFLLAIAVTFLFGLPAALHAAAVKPASALRGGSNPHSRRRLMHTLIALQTAFCFMVLFVSGLFAATFDRLSGRPMGFVASRLLTVETVAEGPQPPAVWEELAGQLRALPGVTDVAIGGSTLLSGASWNGFVSVSGAPPGPVLAYFLSVSPGWIHTMRIPFAEGRDFGPRDTSPGVAIVNQAFVRQFFDGVSPIGKWFAKGQDRYQVVGVVHDAPYQDLREISVPVAYVPFYGIVAGSAVRPSRATLFVRTAVSNPMALASTLRRAVPRARSEFRVSNIRSQEDLVRAQTVRERLLASLGLFFAVVAVLLAGVGLFGVLDYSVLQRRREIGIRMAIGARSTSIARSVTVTAFSMVLLGAAAGLGLGLASARYLQNLLYQVKPNDPAMLALPAVTIAAAALLAAVPAVIRALRIDPAAMLRAD